MAGSDEFWTPQPLFDILDEEFEFTIDVAARAANAKCKFWLGPDSEHMDRRDALNDEWINWESIGPDTAWCNPPHSMLPEFVERAWHQCQHTWTTVVMLIPTYTDPKYWSQIIVPHADEVRNLIGRVSFLDEGVKKSSARFPSSVVVFRPRRGRQLKTAHVWWWDWRVA